MAQAGPGGRHERTLLLVHGDHGQTATGDHGGGSPEEVDTPILAVNLAAAAARRAAPAPPGDGGGAAGSGGLPVVQQLDYAASLSAMLGLPLPFENVGEASEPHCRVVCKAVGCERSVFLSREPASVPHPGAPYRP